MLINGSALNRAAINASAKRGVLAASAQAQSGSASLFLAYRIATSQAQGAHAMLLVRMDQLLSVDSRQAQSGAAVLIEWSEMFATFASAQTQSAVIETESEAFPHAFTATIQSSAGQLGPTLFLSGEGEQTQLTEAELLAVLDATDGVSGQSQMGAGHFVFDRALVIATDQVQGATSEMVVDTVVFSITLQAQSGRATTTAIAPVLGGGSQVQGSLVENFIFQRLMLNSSGQAQSALIALVAVPPPASVSSQTQSGLVQVLMSLGGFVGQTQQAQRGAGSAASYILTPLESSAFVPAETYGVKVPVYGRWVIVPPELPDAEELEQDIEAEVLEQANGALVAEFENSAEVTA